MLLNKIVSQYLFFRDARYRYLTRVARPAICKLLLERGGAILVSFTVRSGYPANYMLLTNKRSGIFNSFSFFHYIMNFLFVKGFFIRNKKINFLLFLVKNNGVYFDVKQKINAP